MDQKERRELYSQISLKELKKENKYYIPNIIAINSIHNIFYITDLTKQSLLEKRNELILSDDEYIESKIPDHNGVLKLKKKKKSKNVKILKEAIRFNLYSNSIISICSTTEIFLEKIIRISLRSQPKRLSQSVKKQYKKNPLSEPEIEVKVNESSIPLRNVLDSSNIEELYESVITDKILQLMYASPNDYFSYLDNVLGIKIDEDLKLSYIEIKATRDLLTHNQGFINDVYIQKSGKKARVTDKQQRIPLSEEYFNLTVGIMKQIINIIYKEASKVYLGITRDNRLYPPKK